MKIYDITQDLLSCEVYPGDPAPRLIPVKRIDDGSLYNLSELSVCVHNGTHIDAPYHFIDDGKKTDEIPLYKTVGMCCVAEFSGWLSGKDAQGILDAAKGLNNESHKRILIKGDVTVSAEAARVFADDGIYLIGVESQSVGEENAPMEVHHILLKREVVLLEGIRLGDVPEGSYLLSAAPMKIKGSDGSPVRAYLIKTQ